MEIIGYISMLLVGGSLGLIGGGGSILTVPILVYFFSKSPAVATGYSLFIVGISSLIGTYKYYKDSLVEYRSAIFFVVPSFVGTYLARRIVLPEIPESMLFFESIQVTKDQIIMTTFAAVMISASFAMIRKSHGQNRVAEHSPNENALISLLGFFVGFVGGFVGAGGGFLIIPALVAVVGLPMPMAVGTSLLIISLNSLFGFASDFFGGVQVDWLFLLPVAILASLGIFGGSHLAKYVSPAKLKSGFGWFVLAVGSVILFFQFY